MSVKYKLDKAFENYTGLLAGVYPVQKGVATVPDESEKKAGRMLETHYGAKKIVETQSEPKK